MTELEVKIVGGAEETLKEIANNFKTVGNRVTRTTQSVNALNKTTQNSNKLFRQQIGILKAMGKQNKTLIQATKDLTEMIEIESGEVVDVTEDIGKLTEAERKNTKQTDNMAKSFLKASIQLEVLKFAVRGVAKVLGAMKDALFDSVKGFASLDTAARKTAVFAGLTDVDDIAGKLTDTFNRLAINSLYSSGQIASAFEEIASVADFAEGQVGVDQLNALGIAMVGLATATGAEDVADVGETLAKIVNSFGIDMLEAGAVADLLAAVANETAFSVTSIGDAMQYASGQAQLVGMNIIETSAVLGVLSNTGLLASQAGTSLAEALKKMADPSTEAQNTMDRLGLSFFDTEGNMRDMAVIVPELQAAMAGLSEEDRAIAMFEMFGTRGTKAMQRLMDNEEMLISLTETFGDAAGTVFDGVEFMMGGIEGAMQRLRGTFEAIKTQMGEALAPAIITIAELLTDIFQDEGILTFLEGIGQLVFILVENLLPIIKIIMQQFGALMSDLLGNSVVLTMIGDLFGVIGRMIAMLMPVIGKLVKMFISVLLPAILAISEILEEVLYTLLVENKEIFDDLINSVGFLARIIMGILVPVLQTLAPVLSWIIGGLLANFVNVIKFITDGLLIMIQVVQKITQGLVDMGIGGQMMIDMNNNLKGVIKGTDSFADSVGNLDSSWGDLNDTMDDSVVGDDIFGEEGFDFRDQEITLVDDNGDPIDTIGLDPTSICETFAEFIDAFRGTSITDIIDLEELGYMAGISREEDESYTTNIEQINVYVPPSDDPEETGDDIAETIKTTITPIKYQYKLIDFEGNP